MVSRGARQVSVLVAQFPIALDINENLREIHNVLSRAEPDDLVVLPEGALSGYDEDPTFLRDVDTAVLGDSLRRLRDDVSRGRLHLVFGSCLCEEGRWYNAGLYFGPRGERSIYRKINLAHRERGAFSAGSELGIIQISLATGPLKLALQLCREIRFPEQWGYLARAGAEVFAFLTNALGDERMAPVWRSHLVSRAAENQRFVLAANNAGREQKCPSLIAAPSGEVLWETLSPAAAVARRTLDLSEVSDWYLSQSRQDVVALVGRTPDPARTGRPAAVPGEGE
jgi:predicted amidohydrolase